MSHLCVTFTNMFHCTVPYPPSLAYKLRPKLSAISTVKIITCAVPLHHVTYDTLLVIQVSCVLCDLEILHISHMNVSTGDGSQHSKATFIPTRTDGDARFSVRPWPWLRSYQHGRPRTDGKKMARTKKQKLMLWWWWRRRVNKVHSIRRFSVHPVNRLRHVHGEYHHLIPVLLDDPFKFAEYLRMNPDTFHDLLEIQGRI